MEEQIVGHARRTGALFSRQRICLVTAELEGLGTNGGIGSVVLRLAQALSEQGADLEILYTRIVDGRRYSRRGEFADHVTRFARFGIRLTAINGDYAETDWLGQSFEVLEHLVAERFDAVFFNDLNGTGYYSLLSRRLGNRDLQNTKMFVFAHGATQWVNQLGGTPIRSLSGITLVEMERRSLELADVVVAPSAYILEKYQGYGWTLSQRTVVMPNLVLWSEVETAPVAKASGKEITFFGRLEARKGLWMFCAALDRLKGELVGRRVTFLGKPVFERGTSTETLLVRRSAAWPCEVSIVTDLDRESAISYLRRHDQVAVMPSPEDNSPSVIIECLAHGVPFIASAGGGGKELVDSESRKANFFNPDVASLAKRLRRTFAEGCSTSNPSFDAARARQSYLAELAKLLPQTPRPERPRLRTTEEDPAASTIVVIVPDDVSAAAAAGAAAHLSDLHRGCAEILLLATDPTPIRRELDASGSNDVEVKPTSEYESVVSVLAKNEDSLTAFCHFTQPIGAEWIHRARQAHVQGGTVAITGMVESWTSQDRTSEEPGSGRRVARFLFGPSPVLQLLTQQTNSGFAVFHSQVLRRVATVSPVDPETGNFKRMEDWIHEVICMLSVSGERVELVPDLLMPVPVREKPSEVFRLGSVLRTMVRAQRGHQLGGDQALLARLAMENAQRPLREAAHADCIKDVAVALRNRMPVGHVFGHGGLSELTMIANVVGHEEAATELMVMAAFPEMLPDADLGNVVKATAAAIRLYDLAAVSEGVLGFNLDHDWSFKLIESARDIEIHPNVRHQGRAVLEFKSLNLTKTDTFQCGISLPGRDAKSVRFRIDIIAAAGSGQFTTDRVLQPGESTKWEFALPEPVRCVARVLLSVEASDPASDPVHSYTRWHDPCFTREIEGRPG